MKIQSPDFSTEVSEDVSRALGLYLGLEDNERNIRPATAQEIKSFCFGPLKKIYDDFVTKRAITANPPQVTLLEL